MHHYVLVFFWQLISSWTDDWTWWPLMVHVRSAAGFDWSEEQESRRVSPGARRSTLELLSPEIWRWEAVRAADIPHCPTLGGAEGRTITRRSPYLLSVLNTGASVLTSHLNLQERIFKLRNDKASKYKTNLKKLHFTFLTCQWWTHWG